MSSDVMSEEENGADENDTLLLNSNAHTHCHCAMCRLLPIIGMSYDLQRSLRLRPLFITSCYVYTWVCLCVHSSVCVRVWSDTATQNATRCSDSCSSTSLSSDPSVLTNNICQVDNKPDGSFVFLVTGNEKPTEQQVISLKRIYQNIGISETL